MVAPTAQRSVRASTSVHFPRACSGGMYEGVPMAAPVCVSPPSPDASARRAMPKSRTLTLPSRVRNRFAGLMSR